MEVSVAEPIEKPGIYIRGDVLYVRGTQYIARVAELLRLETRLKLLSVLREKEISMKELALLTGQSKANISAQIKKLEEIGLVETRYKRGVRGVKKVCRTRIREIRFILD